MANERVVFNSAFDGLFLRALATDMTPALVERLKKSGLDVTQRLLPAYPIQVWVDAIDLACAAVYPTLSRDDACHRLGRRIIEGYQQTLIGRALFATLRVIGPRRTLDRVAKSFRTSNNFAEAKLTEETPRRFALWMNEVETNPHLTAGVIERGLELAGAKEVRVTMRSRDHLGCVLECSWA
jgi:uncharacterized protein (TIGR02265 family)